MRRETDRQLYVYALSAPGFPRRLAVRGRTLRALSIGKVDVIVGRPPSPDRTVEAVQRQHRIVGELAARTSSLLPARFGSAIDEDALRSLIFERQDELREALTRVRHCQQMTIRVFGAIEHDAVPLAPPMSGADYLARRRERALHEPPDVAVIRRALAGVVKAERVEPGERGIRVTVYHLVAARRLAEYRRRASALQSLPTASAVTVTGPWPPFAFAPELF
jgi:hypothetical protein